MLSPHRLREYTLRLLLSRIKVLGLGRSRVVAMQAALGTSNISRTIVPITSKVRTVPSRLLCGKGSRYRYRRTCQSHSRAWFNRLSSGRESYQPTHQRPIRHSLSRLSPSCGSSIHHSLYLQRNDGVLTTPVLSASGPSIANLNISGLSAIKGRIMESTRYVSRVQWVAAPPRPTPIPVLVGSYGSERTQPSFPRWRRGPRRGIETINRICRHSYSGRSYQGGCTSKSEAPVHQGTNSYVGSTAPNSPHPSQP